MRWLTTTSNCRRIDLLLAEGLKVESYLDVGDRSQFANSPGAVRLHPDFARSELGNSGLWETLGRAPLILSGPKVEARASIGCVRRRNWCRQLLGLRRPLDTTDRISAGFARERNPSVVHTTDIQPPV